MISDNLISCLMGGKCNAGKGHETFWTLLKAWHGSVPSFVVVKGKKATMIGTFKVKYYISMQPKKKKKKQRILNGFRIYL